MSQERRGQQTGIAKGCRMFSGMCINRISSKIAPAPNAIHHWISEPYSHLASIQLLRIEHLDCFDGRLV